MIFSLLLTGFLILVPVAVILIPVSMFVTKLQREWGNTRGPIIKGKRADDNPVFQYTTKWYNMWWMTVVIVAIIIFGGIFYYYFNYTGPDWLTVLD